MPKKNKLPDESEKKTVVTKELSDKEKVLKLCKDAKMCSMENKKGFFIEAKRKIIASGKHEDEVWKRALRALL